MTIRVLGDPLSPGGVGPRQVPSLPATKLEQPPIQVSRWVRNNKHPNAEYESLKNEALNQAAIFRTKDYCGFFGALGAPEALSASADRWRFAFKSGPYAHAAFVRCVTASPGPSWAATNAYVQLNLHTSPTEAATVLTEQFAYGPRLNPSSSPLGWKYVRVIDKIIDGITPNTDYYALVRNVNGAAVLGFCMFELASMTENFAGYMPQNLAVQGPILDVYREKQRQLAAAIWQGGAPKVFNWSTDPGLYPTGSGPAFNYTYKERSSAVGLNILDLTSTAVSVNTPGWQPDMRTKNTLRQSASGVPCVMKAFGAMSAGVGGNVSLKDSSGAVVAQVNNVFTTTPGWQSVTFNLPATYAKYDVHFGEMAGGANTFKLWAVSAYELG